MIKPCLYIVVPCYNEESVLPITAPLFKDKLEELICLGKISDSSKVVFVDDGSKDRTWHIIKDLAEKDSRYSGICLSRNRGHQNALLAGLMDSCEKCEITISIDCDGQDDINAMNSMVEEYLNGCEIVYGVRSSRETDKWFKRTSAQGFYKFMNFMGAEVVYNHADYRLVSSRVLKEFSNYKEVNFFLRGMFPLVGFKSTSVYYVRKERIAGESHYPLRKMLNLAFEGITSLSIKPMRLITCLGLFFGGVSVLLIVWTLYCFLSGKTVPGWSLIIIVSSMMGGIQLTSLGIIGEYVGKMYMETKARPRYIISERVGDKD